MLKKLSIEDVEVRGKRVLIRVDFNVPISEKGEIMDLTKIKVSLPTIQYCIERGAKVILMSHLGRPKGRSLETLTLSPIAKALQEFLKIKIEKLPNCIGEDIKKRIMEMKEKEVIILENLRFHKEEEENDDVFAKYLASYADVYVNDAFGSSHRKHASVFAITKYIKPAVCGLLLKKEIENLSKIVELPQKPFLAIIGGVKISTKIDVIKSLLEKVDFLAIGGAMAYTFLKALGIETGKSQVEADKLDVAKEIMLSCIANDIEFLLPKDHLIANFLSSFADVKMTDSKSIQEGWYGVDIGKKTILSISNLIKKAKTIFFNGPLGIVEIEAFSNGTKEIIKQIENSSAISIIGGGDSAMCVNKFSSVEKFTWVSTGGGACLEFLSYKTLPGIEVLDDR